MLFLEKIFPGSKRTRSQEESHKEVISEEELSEDTHPEVVAYAEAFLRAHLNDIFTLQRIDHAFAVNELEARFIEWTIWDFHPFYTMQKGSPFIVKNFSRFVADVIIHMRFLARQEREQKTIPPQEEAHGEIEFSEAKRTKPKQESLSKKYAPPSRKDRSRRRNELR